MHTHDEPLTPARRRRTLIAITAVTGVLALGAVTAGVGTSPRAELVAVTDGTSNT